jgi:hypothetical protein
MIANTEPVESYFGYWPEFADAPIERFSYDKSGELSLTLNYIDAEQGLAAIVTLQFNGVSDVELTDILQQNVVDKLSATDSSPFRLEIEACYGLCGGFTYTSAQVAAFIPRSS